MENEFQSRWQNETYNYDENVFDLNRIIVGLSDARRRDLFAICGSLLGSSLSMKKVEEDNELSPRIIDIDGQNISTGSTGTRLLLTLLGLCMDDRFSTIMIDEPELGLSPKVQTVLANFLQEPSERLKYFPHLKRVMIATHSHIFLGRRDISDNYMVSKEGPNLRLVRVQSISDFHTLQFNLLGNALETLYFPSAIVVVEGKSDFSYMQRLISLRFSGRRVTVVSANGDPKAKVHALRDVLGDLGASPFRSRLFVVVDKVHAAGLQADLERMGLLPGHFVCWNANGIEFIYPSAILSAVFGGVGDPSSLSIDGDRVSANGITKTKVELAEEVVRRLTPDVSLPAEIETKLLTRLAASIAS